MTIRHPPRLAMWILKRLATTAADEAVLGDLSEEYQRRRSPVWFWWQALAAIGAGARRDVGRHWGSALLSWVAMVLATALLVYASATITGNTGDIDIKTAEGAALTVAVVLALPLAAVAALFLLPLGAAANWLLRTNDSGRFIASVGTLLGLPAFVLFFVLISLWGGKAPLATMQRAAATRDPVFIVLPAVFMIGGAVVGLGIRRRERGSHMA